jgi:hypothetical protein
VGISPFNTNPGYAIEIAVDRVEKIKFLEKAKDDIEAALKRDGGYSHNVITLALQSIAQKLGKHTANDVIEEYDLGAFGWDKEP